MGWFTTSLMNTKTQGHTHNLTHRTGKLVRVNQRRGSNERWNRKRNEAKLWDETWSSIKCNMSVKSLQMLSMGSEYLWLVFCYRRPSMDLSFQLWCGFRLKHTCVTEWFARVRRGQLTKTLWSSHLMETKHFGASHFSHFCIRQGKHTSNQTCAVVRGDTQLMRNHSLSTVSIRGLHIQNDISCFCTGLFCMILFIKRIYAELLLLVVFCLFFSPHTVKCVKRQIIGHLKLSWKPQIRSLLTSVR